MNKIQFIGELITKRKKTFKHYSFNRDISKLAKKEKYYNNFHGEIFTYYIKYNIW